MSLAEHSAPGPGAGFSFQFERALLYLAKSSKGSIVGIETDDDVAVREVNGMQILEQNKHSIQADAKPFGNRSKDLWNTLKIWIEALDSHEVAAGKTLFMMVTNKALPDCIAHRIGKAEDDEEISQCIGLMEAEAKSPPNGISHLVERVMRSDSRANLRNLIKRCRMQDGADSTAGDELHAITISHLQLPQWCANSAESIFNELLGWLHNSVLANWQRNEPAWIKRDHFVNQLHAIIDSRKRSVVRERAEHLIHVGEEKIGERKGSVFVKQLHLITDDDNVVDTAIREFLRCNIEKSRLSEEGNVTDDDWLAFESNLLSRWNKIYSRITRMRADTKEEDIGFEIFTETTEAYCEKLAGSDTEQVYLTSGTYHRLAEVVRVGWHPQFKQMIK